MNARKSAPNSAADHPSSDLAIIRSRLGNDPALAYVGEKLKDFPVSSPHYGRWNQVAWLLVAPREETTDPATLSQILGHIRNELWVSIAKRPETSNDPCVYASGKVRIGNLSFREKLGIVKLTKGHTEAVISLEENGDDTWLPSCRTLVSWDGRLHFTFKSPSWSSAPLIVESPIPEFGKLYRCTVVSLFPTKLMANEAFGTISLPREYILMDIPVHMRKEDAVPTALRL